MANPILTSDLYKDTGEFTKLLADLDAVNAKLVKLRKDELAQAAALEKQMEKLNTNRDEEREQIAAGAKQTEEITKRLKKYNESLGENGVKIAGLKSAQQQLNMVNKLEAKLLASKEGSYNKLSAQYSLNKIKLNQLSAEERSATKEGRELEEQTKEIYEEMKRLQEATGKHTLSVGDYAKALGPLGSKFTEVSGKMKAFIRNPVALVITAIVGALALLRKSMTRSEEGQDRLNKVTTIMASVFDNVMDIITELGVALFDYIPKVLAKAANKFNQFTTSIRAGFKFAELSLANFLGQTDKAERLTKELDVINTEMKGLKKTSAELSEEMEGAFDGVIEKAKGFVDEVDKDIAAAKVLADLQATLNKEERRVLVENAKLLKQSTDLRAVAEQFKKTAAEESIKALEKVFDLEERAAANEVALAKVRFSIAKQTSALASDTIEAKKEIADAEAAIFNAESSLNQKRRERLKQLNTFRLEAFKQESDRRKNELDIIKLNAAAEIQTNKDIVASKVATTSEKLGAIQAIAEAEALIREEEFGIQMEVLKKEKELLLKSEEDYISELAVLEAKKTAAFEKGARDRVMVEDKIREEIVKKKKEEAELLEKLDGENAKKRLAAYDQVLATRAARDAANTALTEDEKTRRVIQAEIDRWKKILELDEKFGQKLNIAELERIENLIVGAQQRMDAVGKGKEKDKDLFDILGIKVGEEQKEALKTATSFAIEQITSFADKQVEIADKNVENARSAVEQAQTVLQAETEALRLGEASRVESAAKDLENAKKAQQAALVEQRKAQKQQAAIDSLQQVSSLVTASAKLWSELSLGAIPAIAIMFGSFLATKARAASLTKEPLGEGAYEIFKGGSHRSGNDIPLEMTGEGKMRTVEGGEARAIFPKRSVKKYGPMLKDVVDTIRMGTFLDNYQQVTNTAKEVPILQYAGERTDTGRMEQELSAIRAQGEKRSIVDSEGNIIEYYKGNKTTYLR